MTERKIQHCQLSPKWPSLLSSCTRDQLDDWRMNWSPGRIRNSQIAHSGALESNQSSYFLYGSPAQIIPIVREGGRDSWLQTSVMVYAKYMRENNGIVFGLSRML